MPPRDGALALFVAVPEKNLVTVPVGVPLDKAALAEPMAVGWHAARRALEALHPAMDRRALVIGGGAIGLAAALSLRAMGVADTEVVETNDLRCAYLQARCDQTGTARPTRQAALVIDAVGFAATRAIASEIVAPGGVLVHVGLGEDKGGLDVRRMTLQEITFIGTYTYSAMISATPPPRVSTAASGRSTGSTPSRSKRAPGRFATSARAPPRRRKSFWTRGADARPVKGNRHV